MVSEQSDPNKIAILVTTDSSGTRRDGLIKKVDIDVNQLSVNVNLFVNQMKEIIDKTPEDVGTFRLSEIEVSAEISAKGQVILLGTGGEVGVTGSIKFVFKK